MRAIFFYSFLAVLVSSCGGSDKDKLKRVANVSVASADSNVAVFATDSIDLLYFTKPFTDSSRYTRYFSVAKVSDSTLERLLSITLDGPSSIMDKPRPCLSEGKIVIPKGGDAFKVLYFSRTGENQCRYIYEIKDGQFLYYQITEALEAGLNKFEKIAVKVE
jgi:hypothetical protein